MTLDLSVGLVGRRLLQQDLLARITAHDDDDGNVIVKPRTFNVYHLVSLSGCSETSATVQVLLTSQLIISGQAVSFSFSLNICSPQFKPNANQQSPSVRPHSGRLMHCYRCAHAYFATVRVLDGLC